MKKKPFMKQYGKNEKSSFDKNKKRRITNEFKITKNLQPELKILEIKDKMKKKVIIHTYTLCACTLYNANVNANKFFSQTTFFCQI